MLFATLVPVISSPKPVSFVITKTIIAFREILGVWKEKEHPTTGLTYRPIIV